MKSIHIFIFVVSIVLFLCSGNYNKIYSQGKESSSETIVIKNDLGKFFTEFDVIGSAAIFDNNKKTWIFNDSADVYKEALPASTFKIINLLIALETGVIKNEKEVIKWVGSVDTVLYGYRPDIYHDMSVKEAFKVSAGWVFIELAKKIGKDRYKQYLTACNYGNVNLSQKDYDFWNFGDFAISPVNQVRFLRSVYEENVPFSKRNIDILKRLMITETTKDYTIRAKTGWTSEGNNNIGWWVGYSQSEKGVFFFATRIFQTRNNKNSPLFSASRKTITKNILKKLNAIP
jgi:beta-lactamase class D